MKKKYFFITIGCQMNVSDTERFAAFLDSKGFSLAASREKADIVIINTCGVKQMAEDRAYGLVHTIRKKNKGVRIVITGCLSQRKDVKKRLMSKVDWFLPVGDMFLLPDLLNGLEYKTKYSSDDYRLKSGEKYLKVKPKYSSNYSAYVPIGNGCNNFCAYCVVPYARGREVYRPAKEIISEVKSLIKKGFKEIVLVAQNVNSYKDVGYNFPSLLSEIASIPGKFWLRFYSSHPKDMSDELIKVIGSSNKICSHLHLALQSGDDKILKAMNRKYEVKDYKLLIKKIREAKPGIAITTDIIVGFPGEGKRKFLNTASVFNEIGFDMAYISQYSPRPGTVSAEEMKDDVDHLEKKRRFDFLNGELKRIATEKNKEYLGKTVEVLVDGINKKNKYFGKTSSSKTVLISSKKDKLKPGTFVEVVIKSARPFGLEAELVKPEEKTKKELDKVLVILGPTASGKTRLGIDLARKYIGEIISADSRQVYKGMDIGTGKDLEDYIEGGEEIKHHLIDVVKPSGSFNLAKYQALAFKAIDKVLKKKKLPIIVGGSGLYLQAIIDNYDLSSSVGSDRKYRDSLEKLPAAELFSRLKSLKSDFADKLNNSERNNPRRLARYIEIVARGEELGKKIEPKYNFLVIGLDVNDKEMRSRVSYRILSRLEQGMIAEVKDLKDKGLSNEKLESFGLEYRFINRHLNGEISYKEMVSLLEIASYRFAKRQKSWFKRWQKQGLKINWLQDFKKAEQLLINFLR